MPFDAPLVPTPNGERDLGGRTLRPTKMTADAQADANGVVARMDATQCLRAVRRLADEIDRIGRKALNEGWTRPLGRRNPKLGEVLKEVERLRGLSAALDRQFRGRVLEVDRRNLARILSMAYDAAREGQVGREEFVRRLAALFEDH